MAEIGEKSGDFNDLKKKAERLLELIKLYEQNPLEKFVIFTINPNSTLALTVV